MLIAGATDAEAGAVSFRYRDGSQRNGVPVDEAVAQIADWIAARHNVDSFGRRSDEAEVAEPARPPVRRRARRGRGRRAERAAVDAGSAGDGASGERDGAGVTGAAADRS